MGKIFKVRIKRDFIGVPKGFEFTVNSNTASCFPNVDDFVAALVKVTSISEKEARVIHTGLSSNFDLI